MVHSMGNAPIMNYGFKHIVVNDETGSVSSVHVVPAEQFAHDLDSQGSCLCGPNIDWDTASGIIVARVIHFALDKGYYQYDPQDVFG